jgi:RNA polymerase sigma-70 factor, ECF subfamily
VVPSNAIAMSSRVLRPVNRASGAAEPVRSVSGAEQSTDSALVNRAIAGDRWAEEALYRRHAETLLGACTRLLRDPTDAEDVVQDAFIDAFGELGNLREPSQFRAWLTGIAVHKVHRRLRRRKLLRALGLWNSEREQSLENCLAPGVSAECYAEIICLDLTLRRLPDAQRIAWQLRYAEGFRLEEVATLCGCSLATAKRRIAEADAQVRRSVTLEEAGRE